MDKANSRVDHLRNASPLSGVKPLGKPILGPAIIALWSVSALPGAAQNLFGDNAWPPIAVTDPGSFVSRVVWQRFRAPEMPRDVYDDVVMAAYVVVECAAQPDGRLKDCEAVHEEPRGLQFGREATRAARRSQVRFVGDNPPSAPVSVRFISLFCLRDDLAGRSCGELFARLPPPPSIE